MKKMLAVILAAGLLLLSACTLGDAQLRDIKKRGVLRVGIKVDVPFFGYIDPETNEIEGLEIDLARALAESIFGNEDAVELFAVNAKTRGPMLNNGIVDVVMATFTITEERQLVFNFSQPYYTDEIGVLVRNDSPIYDLSALDGKTVGVAQASTTSTALAAHAEALGITVSFREFANCPEIMAALLDGRVDAFSIDGAILRGYVDDETRLLDKGFDPQEYGIATKLENAAWARHVDNFVAKLKKSGELDNIIAKWGI